MAYLKGEENEDATKTVTGWIKMLGLLSTIKQRYPEQKTVYACLTNLPENILRELHAKRQDNTIFVPGLLSTTLDRELIDSEFLKSGPPVEKMVVLEISGVYEGIDLSRVSYYPKEQELLLPLFTTLKVVSSRYNSRDGHEPLRIQCKFEGSGMSLRLQKAVWSDLYMASSEILRLLGDFPAESSSSPEKTGSPTNPSLPAKSSSPAKPSSPSRIRPKTPASPSASSPSRMRAPPAGADDKRKTIYTDRVFKSIFDVFTAMDRRNVYAISYDDYIWSQTALGSNKAFQRISRQAPMSVHFYNSSCDLTLHRFLAMCLPGATEWDLTRMLRWAIARVREDPVPRARILPADLSISDSKSSNFRGNPGGRGHSARSPTRVPHPMAAEAARAAWG